MPHTTLCGRVLLILSAASCDSDLGKRLQAGKWQPQFVGEISAALHQVARANFDLVLAEWEHCQTRLDQPSEATAFETLTQSGHPIVFYSNKQTPSVKFKQLDGNSFYCLRSSDCPELLASVAKLARQARGRVPYPERGQESLPHRAPITATVDSPSLPSLSFPNLTDTLAVGTNSAIHVVF